MSTYEPPIDDARSYTLMDRIEACETIVEAIQPCDLEEMRLTLQEVVGILKEIVLAAGISEAR